MNRSHSHFRTLKLIFILSTSTAKYYKSRKVTKPTVIVIEFRSKIKNKIHTGNFYVLGGNF